MTNDMLETSRAGIKAGMSRSHGPTVWHSWHNFVTLQQWNQQFQVKAPVIHN